MKAIDSLAALLSATDVMSQLLMALREEPAHMLGDICRKHQATGEPVPDHLLQLAGIVNDVARRALLSAGLIVQTRGQRLSLHSYEPSPKGLKLYKRLEAEGTIRSN